MTTVAVMQPYFFPYAGYYRLLAEADVFVIFDCVQFPRRGWVHRNKLPRDDGSLDWLTLPIRKPAYDDLICDLQFAEKANLELGQRCRTFPTLRHGLEHRRDHPVVSALTAVDGTVVDYLERTLRAAARELGYSPELYRSSSVKLSSNIRAQERVLRLAQEFGAKRYVNLSGGGDYYDAASFAREGIELAIFKPYEGGTASLLERLLAEEIGSVKREISANCIFTSHGTLTE